jgi:hypothetical protein
MKYKNKKTSQIWTLKAKYPCGCGCVELEREGELIIMPKKEFEKLYEEING